VIARWIEINQVSIAALILILVFDVVAPRAYRARGTPALIAVSVLMLTLAYILGALLVLLTMALFGGLSLAVILSRPRARARAWICVSVSLLVLAIAAACLVGRLTPTDTTLSGKRRVASSVDGPQSFPVQRPALDRSRTRRPTIAPAANSTSAAMNASL